MTAMAVMGGLTTASTALQIKQGRDVAKAQQEVSRLDKIASQQATRQAEQDAAEQEAMDLATLTREALRAEGTVQAQQAYSGVAGVSSERVRNNLLFQKSLDEANIRTDAQNKLLNIRAQGRQNARQITNQAYMADVKKPSYLAGALSVASQGAQMYVGAKGFK